MSDQVQTVRTVDASAIMLSGLCVIHCLALPLMAAALPLAGVLAEAEWVHKLFVLVAVPLSGFAMARTLNSAGGAGFILLASTGLALLLSAAFVERFHQMETLLTVIGALLLATAHIWRWSRHRAGSVRPV